MQPVYIKRRRDEYDVFVGGARVAIRKTIRGAVGIASRYVDRYPMGPNA